MQKMPLQRLTSVLELTPNTHASQAAQEMLLTNMGLAGAGPLGRGGGLGTGMPAAGGGAGSASAVRYRCGLPGGGVPLGFSVGW